MLERLRELIYGSMDKQVPCAGCALMLFVVAGVDVGICCCTHTVTVTLGTASSAAVAAIPSVAISTGSAVPAVAGTKVAAVTGATTGTAMLVTSATPAPEVDTVVTDTAALPQLSTLLGIAIDGAGIECRTGPMCGTGKSYGNMVSPEER